MEGRRGYQPGLPSLLIAIRRDGGLPRRLANAPAGVARGLSAVAMAGVGLSLAASGHAASAPPQWLTRPAVFLHGVAVAYWIGALCPWPR